MTRFEQLCKIINPNLNSFAICDLGCYGALYNFLTHNHSAFFYYEVDISNDMIDAANKRHINQKNAYYLCDNEPNSHVDYLIARGIFNVKLNLSSKERESYIEDTLDILNKYSNCGFSFNCLTVYSDVENMKESLFYTDPVKLFNLCKRKFSKNVALLHDYDLYKFTILVRKNYEKKTFNYFWFGTNCRACSLLFYNRFKI